MSNEVRHLLRFCFRVEFEEGLFTSSIQGGDSSQNRLGVTIMGSFRTKWGISYSIERGKVPLSNLPRKDFNLIWGSLEGVMSNPLNWIGDPSSFCSSEWHILERGLRPLSNFSPKAKKIINIVMPSVARHLPILERGFHPLSNFSPKAQSCFWVQF